MVDRGGDGWIDGCVFEKMDMWMALLNGRVGEWVSEWMQDWWVSGWMDGRTSG